MILNFREIADRAMEKTDLVSTLNTTQLNKVLDWINLRYDRIIRAYPWPLFLRTQNVTVIASTNKYVLDEETDEITTIVDITNGRTLNEISGPEYDEFIAPSYDVSSSETKSNYPQGYFQLYGITCKQLMTIADKVQVVSSVAGDATPNAVRVCGQVSGIETCENIIINGTTAVDSTNTFDSGSLLRISVGTTTGVAKTNTGNITVREKTTATNIKAVMNPAMFAASYKWIQIFPLPDTSGTYPTLRVRYRKKVNLMTATTDIPAMDCCTELVQGAYADILWNDGQQSAQVEESRFNAMVEGLIKKEETNPNYVMRFTPRGLNQNTYGDNRNGFMGNKAYSGV